MAFPKVGNMAPAFTLQDQDGNKVSLKDFKGKKNVVLYFYPKAMTPGCTVQACGIRDSKKALAKLDTVVLGVSPDPVARLGRFIEKQDRRLKAQGPSRGQHLLFPAGKRLGPLMQAFAQSGKHRKNALSGFCALVPGHEANLDVLCDRHFRK